MNMTMYPSLLGKFIPAIWGYEWFMANASGGIPLPSHAEAPATVMIQDSSVIDVRPATVLEMSKEWDEWPVVDEDGEGDEEEDGYVDWQEYKWSDEDEKRMREQEEEEEGEDAGDGVDWRDYPKYSGYKYDDLNYDLVSEYEYGEEGSVWYGYVMEKVYGFDMGKLPFKSQEAMGTKENLNTPQFVLDNIKYGVQTNMKIRDQICVAGMVIMSVSCILVMFCILISCCSGKRTRRVVNESLKEPLLKIDELSRKLAGQNTRPPTAPPLPAHSKNRQVIHGGVADGEVVDPPSVDAGLPRSNMASPTLSYV